MKKDPARRFQHMDDLKVALEELKEESESGKLAVVSPSTAPAKQGSKRLLLVGGVACGLIAGALAGS